MSIYYNDIDPYCCKVLRARITDGLLPQGNVDENDIRSIPSDTLRGYRQLHLFAGIGGFPLGMRMAGFPEDVSIITGGFPCQPHSMAGKRKGSGDERNLWPEFYRVIRDLRPQWVLAENVRGLLSSDDGRFFGGILRDLAHIGYDAEWQMLSASAFGAPHERERIFIIAYPCNKRLSRPVFRRASVCSTTLTSPTKFGNRIVPCGLWHQAHIGDIYMGNGVSAKVVRHGVKAMGNAVVPQIIAWIAQCIMESM